jgi:NADH-quinone oxidoreductase subunit C
MSDEETRAPEEGDAQKAPAPDEGAPAAAAGSDPPAETGAPSEPGAPPAVDAEAEKAKAAAVAKAKAEAAAKAKAAKEAAEAAKPPWERDPAVPEWAEAEGDLATAIRAAHGDGVIWARTFAGDLVFMVAREAIRDVARTLHDEHGYTMLIDICGAHYPGRADQPPFEVVYMLLNLDTVERVRLRVATDEETPVPSVVPVWRGANWPEREVFDMYGVRFADHPDMTRILMWEGFTGHPLRKDFPVEGLETGSAIYPEYYDEAAGPVTGTGTGWKPAKDEAAGGAAED